MAVAFDPYLRQIDELWVTSGIFDGLLKFQIILPDRGPARIGCNEVTIDTQCGDVFQGSHFLNVSNPCRLNQHQGFDFVWACLSDFVTKGTRLRVHEHHARAHFVHEFNVGRNRGLIRTRPPRNHLFGEVVIAC